MMTLTDFAGDTLENETFGIDNTETDVELMVDENAQCIVYTREQPVSVIEQFLPRESYQLLFNEHGALTAKARALAPVVLGELLPTGSVGVFEIDSCEEPAVQLTHDITPTDGLNTELTDSSLASTVWNTHATVTNILDPGTFGSVCFFRDLALRIENL